jgi:hypothetical protein
LASIVTCLTTRVLFVPWAACWIVLYYHLSADFILIKSENGRTFQMKIPLELMLYEMVIPGY